MGKAFSMITRPIRNFNIESRAHKIISRDKPTPAPKYKADVDAYEQMMKDNPDILKDALRKDENLNKHLKDVYVKSHDPQVVEKSKLNEPDASRPLPLNRSVVEDFELGFKEPAHVTPGKVTLRQALRFITDHQADPAKCSSTKISDEYVLDEEKVKNILRFFRVYEVYIPEVKRIKGTFAGPSVPKSPTPILERRKRQLLAGRIKTDNNET